MCGIFGVVSSRRSDAAKVVLEGLKTLEYRGYDSWGVGVATDNRIIIKKKAGKIGNANVDELPESNLAFGHTRWATHGGVTDANAHPHLDCSGTLALIHNGIFENYEPFKELLTKKGHKFISETDTEVIVHLIEEYSKSMEFTKAVQKAFNQMEGLNAIIAIKTVDHMLIAARNGSPLVIGFGEGENFLASDAAALLPYTKKVYFLGDNEMAILDNDNVDISNVKTGTRISPKPIKLTWDISDSLKGKFPDFMSKEIHEQPKILENIAGTGVSAALNLSRIIKKSYGTYMVGCGSASYVSLAGSYLFTKIAGRHVNWAVGSEFGYHVNFLTPKSLVIAISQSGETMDILESVKKAKVRGAKIFALVNVLGSSLYRLADYKMLIGAGPEKSVASTKVVTAMLAHLILLSYALASKVSDGQKIIRLASKTVNDLLTPSSIKKFKELATKLRNSQHIYCIGRGLSYPASLETAMKIKEISYVHAEGMPAGELKHGPLALVEKGTPCIAFLPNDETYGANLAGAMEMKARGGFLIGISHKPHEVFDYYLPVVDCGEATIIPNIVTGQLLAYYLTLEKHLDPDMPRNLAKSVTVK